MARTGPPGRVLGTHQPRVHSLYMAHTGVWWPQGRTDTGRSWGLGWMWLWVT